MKINITFEVGSPEEAVVLFGKILGIEKAGNKPDPKAADNGKRRPGRPPKSPEKEAARAAQAAAARSVVDADGKGFVPQAEEKPEVEAVEDYKPTVQQIPENPVTLAEAQAALTKLLEQRDVASGIALLKEFNAAKLANVPESQYPAFVKRVEELLAEDQ
jgi:hypothetical protein